MEAWSTFWGVFLVGALVLFTGLAAAVTVGGIGDIRALVRGLEREHSRAPAGERAGTSDASRDEGDFREGDENTSGGSHP